MKVNTGFVFTEDQLRTVRAALKRGGVATRKECRMFVTRAVEAALHAAPEPKPKRRPAPAPAPETKKRAATGSWRCPACKRFVNEEMNKRCRECRSLVVPGVEL